MFVQTNGLQPPRDKVHILTFVSQHFVLMIPFYLQIKVAAWSFWTKKNCEVTFFCFSSKEKNTTENVHVQQ